MEASPELPTSITSLIFPTSSYTNFSKTLSSLKRATLCITNRLRSIEEDSRFVHRIAELYNLPLVANERCGSWYISPERKAGSAYFKSTDGHQGQWGFSKRRLNLHILEIIEDFNGCIIVDSTRRGKRMPDALSKTIPIWCVVINMLLFPQQAKAHLLHTPPDVIAQSEHAQIEARLKSFLDDAKAIQFDLEPLRLKLKKPLLLFWITQDSALPKIPLKNGQYHPIICCTASRRVDGTDGSEGGYIQGAGDDSEEWSQGLTPEIFWRNKAQLLGTPKEVVPNLIRNLQEVNSMVYSIAESSLISPTKLLHVGRLAGAMGLGDARFNYIIACEHRTQRLDMEERDRNQRVLYLPCDKGKLGSRALRKQLPHLESFMSSILSNNTDPTILFTCSTGLDLAVGAALAVLCLHVDEEGRLRRVPVDSAVIDKIYIRRRLSWITTSKPEANPSRSTLQSVNSFLMQRP